MIDFLFRSRHSLKGTEEISMIVDMQLPYLPAENNSQCEEYILSRRILIQRILESLEKDMDLGNDIILVEYSLVSGTIDELKKCIGKYPHGVLKKNADGLLRSSDRLKNKALETLEPVKKSKINIRGVSISCCERQTGSSLLDNGFNPSIDVRKSLNVIKNDPRDNFSFIQRNSVLFVATTYKNDHPNKDEDWYKRDISHLLDYGIPEVDLHSSILDL